MTRTKLRKYKQVSSPPLQDVSLGRLFKAGTDRFASKPVSEDFVELSKIMLAQLATGNKKEVPGRQYTGAVSFLNYTNAEYLYLTNGYIARGIETESAAIMRNGIEIIPSNKADQKSLDEILQNNDLDLLVNEIARNIAIYGVQFVEIYDDSEKGVRFELIPTPEMDYLRDSMNYVDYDKKTGKPKGYKQKRNGQDIAVWSGKDALRIAEFKYRTLGGCIEGISNLQSTVYAATEFGYIRGSLADSFIRSLPVAHITVEGATPNDIEEVTTAVADKFTARTVYVTSERFSMENSAPANDIDAFKFIEPALSEIAACFNMPIEMLAPTEYLKGDDFLDRYGEWIEYIKVKQKIIASIFEHQVFSVIFKDPVKVRFNSPVAMKTSDLIKNVGFATQSGAITPEMALDILVKNQVFGPYSNEIAKVGQDKTPAEKTEPKEVKETETETGEQDADKQPA